MTTKTFCDACRQLIKTEPNKVTLKSRENLDGGEWGNYDICDDCFKTLQAICWCDTKQVLKDLREMNDDQRINFIMNLNQKEE